MSTINIIIKGEAAEAFAQKLLEIPDISLPKGTQEETYKSGIGKGSQAFVVSVLSSVVGAIIYDIGKQEIQEFYNHYHNQQKLEVKVKEPGKSICTFEQFLLSHDIKSVENSPQEDLLDSSPPSLNPLPSLQEIAKLSMEERHQLLSPYMENMAEIFNNDPDLVSCWDIDGDE